jgi:succinate-acetate transporter protein
VTDTVGQTPKTTVVLRPLGSPVGLGLSGLAIASLLGAGYDVGWVPTAQAHQVGLLVLVTVVPMQSIASVLAYMARDGASGGSFGLQAAAWAAFAASHLSTPPGATSAATGLVLIAAGALLALSGVTVGAAKPLVGAAVGLSGVHFVFAALYDLGGGSGWQNASGAVGLAVVAVAGYTAWASEVEEMAGRPIVPTLRRGGARTAVEGPYREQLTDVSNEAGVRREL